LFNSVARRNDQTAIVVYLDLLLFTSVENLEHIERSLVVCFLPTSRLKQNLDVSQLAEVKIALFLQCVILELEFCDLFIQVPVAAV